MWDDETPAGYRDADIEMAEYAYAAREMERVRGTDECHHDAAWGYLPTPFSPEQVGLKPGECRCRDCGAVFADPLGDLE